MPESGQPRWGRRVLAIVVGAIALFAIWQVSRSGGDRPKFAEGAPQTVEGASAAASPEAADAAAVTPEKRIQCLANLEDWAASGLIKGRPMPQRADVEEVAWAALSYHDKDAVLAALSCDAFGRTAPPGTESTAVYGWHSGEKLRQLTANGVS